MTTTPTDEKRALELFDRALDLPKGERRAFLVEAAGGDETLIGRVETLLRSDDESGEALRTGGAGEDAAEPEHPDEIGAYRITRLIGQGGMGAVYEGERIAGDFDHRVAIKIIRPGALSESLAARFLRERQILAGLNHPHIARLFDGGELEAGAPFMIMEYVDGEPITTYADARNLTAEARLELFRDACTAVRHAHQNLIIHRDITPMNVLVTGDGEVKLIDFGIARPQSEAGAASEIRIDSQSYTPGFAAPERRQGAPANTLSDVFSLGKLLAALFREAGAREITAIAARASARDPDARYPSVDALIEDIDNYLSGRPVEAFGGGTGYRFSKFLKRRRLIMAATFGAFLILSGFLAFASWQYVRAESAHQRADARFEQARGLSRLVIFDVYDQIADVPGTLEARRTLADIVRAYVDELEDDPDAPDDILMDVAVQSTRLSDLYGGIGIANFGETELSWELLLQAESALEDLLEHRPDSLEALDELIWVKRLKTNQQLYYRLDDEGAAETNGEALEAADYALSLPGVEETRIADRFWNARTDRLKVLIWGTRLAPALEDVRTYRADIAEPRWRDRLRNYDAKAAYLASQEGEILVDLDRWREAVEPLEAAYELNETLLEDAPGSYVRLVQKLKISGLLANALTQTGAGPAAVRYATIAVDTAREIVALDPEDASGQTYLATELEALANAEAAAGAPDGARAAIDEAVTIRRAMVEAAPDTLSHRRDLAGVLTSEAAISANAGDVAAQCRALEESRAILEELGQGDQLTGVEIEERLPEIRAAMAEARCG